MIWRAWKVFVAAPMELVGFWKSVLTRTKEKRWAKDNICYFTPMRFIERHKALLLYKRLAEWEQQMKRKHKDISQQFLHVNNQWGGGRYMVEFCHCFPTCDDTIVEARL